MCSGRLLSHQAGVSLVEMVITIVVISIALTASLSSFSFLSGRSSDALVHARMVDLAQMYLDEILPKHFDDDTGPGGIPAYPGGCRIQDDGENRQQYDDVDDYHGLVEAPAFADQSLGDAYRGFSVSIQVSCDDSVGASVGGSKRIEVTITGPGNKTAIFAAYKANF